MAVETNIRPTTIYSKELVQKTVRVFKEEYDHEITETQAIEYVDALANLFLAFSESPVSRSTQANKRVHD